MIQINEQPRTNLNDFSFEFQQIIELIPGGVSWLDWALSSNRSSTIEAPSEASFLNMIQNGLHATDLLRLNALDLIISPSRCMSFSKDDISLLTEPNAPKAHRLADKYGLYTDDDLIAGDQFLKSLGIADFPCFKLRSLTESISLALLAKDDTYPNFNDLGVQKVAANFATTNAQSTDEFICAYLFYLNASASSKTSGAPNPISGKKRIQKAWDKIISASYDSTLSVQIDPETPKTQIIDACREWISNGGQIGFLSMARAAYCYLMSLGPSYELAAINASQVGQYFSEAQSFIRRYGEKQSPPPAGSLSQDGLELSFALEDTEAKAEIVFQTKDGTLALTNFMNKN